MTSLMHFAVTILIVLALAAVPTVAAEYVTPPQPVGSDEAAPAEPTQAHSAWLEPRGLNIVDLVGLVPEEHLDGAIISYTPGYGILTYQSGSRIGNTVTITSSVFPRYFETSGWSGSLFGCLGQPARIDQWGSVAPPTTARLYHQGEEITSEVDLYSYVPAGRTLPVRNPKESERQNRYRYWHKGERSRLPTAFTADGALRLPGNMGCDLIISYRNYEELTAVFTAEAGQEVSVQVVGTEEFTFQSYLGAGYTGLMSQLADQLKAEYGSRHQKLRLNVPQGADYLLLNFPTMPVDPYTQFPDNRYANVDRPTGATYRIKGAGLSIDHVNTMGLPLYGHWRDSGTCDGDYLPYFQEPCKLAAPEYIVPHGVAYDPCMLNGTCPDSLLERIRETRMTMRVIYMQVDRIAGGMDQIPLKMVGNGWHASQVLATASRSPDGSVSPGAAGSDTAMASAQSLTPTAFMPVVGWHYATCLPSDAPGSRPYGWFADDGRMLDFVPAVQ